MNNILKENSVKLIIGIGAVAAGLLTIGFRWAQVKKYNQTKSGSKLMLFYRLNVILFCLEKKLDSSGTCSKSVYLST